MNEPNKKGLCCHFCSAVNEDSAALYEGERFEVKYKVQVRFASCHNI